MAMARQLRILYPGAWYHVTCRGNEKAAIFWDDRDRSIFMKILRDTVELYRVEVHCIVLMLNHFHLIVKTLCANLNRFMHRFNTAYISFFNKQHDRVGHLYQGRYKAILIDAHSYLLELSRYIHLNPVRGDAWQNVPLEEKIAYLESYEWSSYCKYIGEEQRWPFIHTGAVLEHFGKNPTKAHAAYRAFVLQGLIDDMPSPLRHARAQLVLGSPSFVTNTYSQFINGKEREREYTKLRTALPDITFDKIIQCVSEEFAVEPAALVRRQSMHRIPRKILIELCCRFLVNGIPMSEVGSALGGIGTSGIFKTRTRLAALLGKDEKLRKRFERMRDAIICP
jgi:REP element-mobilizing transposase RayT